MSDTATASERGNNVQMIEFRAMGTQVLAALASDSPEAASVLAEVPAWFEAWEDTFSHYRQSSELSRLNRTAQDTPVAVSSTLWEVLQSALQVARYTGGLVSPTVLDSMDSGSYAVTSEAAPRGIFTRPPTTRVHLGSWLSGEVDGRVPSTVVAHVGNALTAWRSIHLDPDVRSVRLPAGVRINFGSTGKGWSADKAASKLAEHGPALVNVGGAIAVSGPTAEGQGWPVGLELPRVHLPGFSHEAADLLLSLRSGGVATSGRDTRRWQPGDEASQHMIDPRTGSPADTDVVAATAVGPNACAAEMASRVALLLGSAAGLEWLEDRPPLAGLLLLESGRVVCTSRLDSFLAPGHPLD